MIDEIEKITSFKGIYVASEAALYLTATLKVDVKRAIDRNIAIVYPIYPINSRNLINWIRVGLASPELRDVRGHDLLLSFEDLISMRVISILRSIGVSWGKIHKAEVWLREKTGYPRPFAIERVWTETEDVFAEFHDTFVVASRYGQLSFPHLLGQYLYPVEDLLFKPVDSLSVADSWKPHEDILINPRIQFGEPCIKGTRIRTRIIKEYIDGGDKIPYLMRVFELTEQQIDHALEWENRLRTAAQNN